MEEKKQKEKQEVKESTYPQANTVKIDIQAPEANIKENTLETVLSKLGINKQNAAIPDKNVGKGLTAKKKEFVVTFAPVASLAFVMVVSWLWARKGEQYKILAPTEEVAAQIITPLVRIYARLTTLETGINPNVVDISSSVLAMMGYILSAYEVYKQIKESEQNTYGTFNEREVRFNDTGHFFDDTAENASSGEDAFQTAPNTARPQRPLTEREQQQYSALAKLGQMDYYSRLRRSNKL